MLIWNRLFSRNDPDERGNTLIFRVFENRVGSWRPVKVGVCLRVLMSDEIICIIDVFRLRILGNSECLLIG